ncbi:MAG: proton-conducting transporter membrane subunit, partial [Candidatus Latescibacterota bacterium]
HILYKALLFMSMGAVLYRVGTVKASELGGLYRSMPITTVFCLIGAAAISAFPLFSGFVTKSMTVSAVGEQHMTLIWLTLTFASAGVLHHSGIRIPFCGFFGHDSGKRCEEAPMNMLVAMGITAFFCIGIGVYPDPLYAILPYAVDYQPYTTGHVVTQLQLLVCALAAFGIIARKHLEPPEIPALNLDTDWVYRRALPKLLHRIVTIGGPIKDGFFETSKALIRAIVLRIAGFHNEQGIWGRTWSTRHSVLIITGFITVYLLFYY